MVSVGKKKKKLRPAVQSARHVQKKRTKTGPEPTAAGFPRAQKGHAAPLELTGNKIHERALSCALHALYSNEHCLSS